MRLCRILEGLLGLEVKTVWILQDPLTSLCRYSKILEDLSKITTRFGHDQLVSSQ